MKKVSSDRSTPQMLDEREAMDNLPGTPQHLLSEAMMSTRGLLDIVEPVLISLDQSTPITSAEGRGRFHVSRLIDQLEAIGQKLDAFELNIYYQNQQSFKQFTDLNAYGAVVLNEIRQCFNTTVQDLMHLINMLCNYSQTLFMFLIPQLEVFYDCKYDAVEMTKMNAQIMSVREKSLDIGTRYQLSELVDTNDHAIRVKEHETGSILLQVDAVLAGLYQKKNKLLRLKVVHPAKISGEITDLHALLHNAALFHDVFLFQVEAIKNCVRGLSKNTNELSKSGFSYVCDKVISDYLSAHYEKVDAVDKKISTVIRQERRRSRSEDYPSKPAPIALTSQGTATEGWPGKFISRRANRVNSMVEVSKASTPENVSGQTKPTTGLSSLSRGSSLGRLALTLPKEKTATIPSTSRESGDNKRQSGDNSREKQLSIQKPCLEAVPEEELGSPEFSGSPNSLRN